jgi:hypothetical protein
MIELDSVGKNETKFMDSKWKEWLISRRYPTIHLDGHVKTTKTSTAIADSTRVPPEYKPYWYTNLTAGETTFRLVNYRPH